MALSFPQLPAWFCRKNPAPPPPSDTPSPSLDIDAFSYQPRKNASFKKSGPSEHFQSVGRPNSRRRWGKKRREVCSLDLDFDMVLVPPDSGCYFSGSDSDDSDWSIGWFEPHSAGFCSDGEPESSFAVLVPCYGSPSADTRGGWGRLTAGQEENSKSQLWATVLSNIAKDSREESKQYLQQWLASLQG